MPKTVFIVGAGASTEFDRSGTMPIGPKLADDIRAMLTAEIASRQGGGETPLIDILSATGGYTGDHMVAMARIRDSVGSRESIDDFINEWGDVPELEAVAKLCIARRLLEAEHASVLSGLKESATNAAHVLATLKATWLGYLMRYNNPDLQGRRQGQALEDTGFVVFNYDRCIEFYLFNYLTRNLAMTADEARGKLENVPIEHVFGSIGTIPELGGHQAFGDPTSYRIRASSQEIRTYNETIDSNRAERIQTMIESAERIFMIGIAFHPQNLKILFPEGRPPARYIRATTLGVRARRIQELERFFKGPNSSLHFAHSPHTAGDMFSDLHDEIF